jgi:hypothetical protein
VRGCGGAVRARRDLPHRQRVDVGKVRRGVIWRRRLVKGCAWIVTGRNRRESLASSLQGWLGHLLGYPSRTLRRVLSTAQSLSFWLSWWAGSDLRVPAPPTALDRPQAPHPHLGPSRRPRLRPARREQRLGAASGAAYIPTQC